MLIVQIGIQMEFILIQLAGNLMKYGSIYIQVVQVEEEVAVAVVTIQIAHHPLQTIILLNQVINSAYKTLLSYIPKKEY